MRKLFFWMLYLVILTSFVSTSVFGLTSDGLQLYISGDSDISDSSPINYNITNSGVIRITSGQKCGAGGLNFSGSDYLNVAKISTWKWLHGANDTSDYSWSANFWYYSNVPSTGSHEFFSTSARSSTSIGLDVTDHAFLTQSIDTITGRGVSGQTVQESRDSGFFASSPSWQMVTLTYNQSLAADNMKVYINGTNFANDTKHAFTPVTSDPSFLFTLGCKASDKSDCLDGRIDEFMLFADRVLVQDDINEMFNNGDCLPNPFVSGLNSSLESALQFLQVGSVNINSATFSTILAGTFNVTVNDSSLYFTSSIPITQSNNNVGSCQTLVNGLPFNSTFQRTNIAGEKGNMYITSDNITLDIDSYDVELQCRLVSGVGNYRVEGAVINGHILVDDNNQILNNIFVGLNVTLGSLSVFARVFPTSVFFSTSDLVADGVFNSTIVMDWNAQYDFDTLGVINTRLSLHNLNITSIEINCSEYPRTNGLGIVGSIGGTCALNNAGFNHTYNVSGEGFGNGTVIANVHIKEFITRPDEVNSVDLINISVNSASNILLANLTINNRDFVEIDLFVKAGIPHESLSGTAESDFFLAIDNQSSVGSVVSNTIEENKSQITVISFLFEDISTGNHSVELWGNCDNANCNLTGGDLTGYLVNPIIELITSFNVSSFDTYDNSSISIFNVTILNGNVFSTSSGSVTVDSNLDLDNLTILSDNFFLSSIFNHNTSFDLNVSLAQSIIRFNAFQKVTGNSINSFRVNDSTISTVTTNGTAILFLNAGNNQVISFFNDVGFFNSSIIINVSALDNVTFNFTELFNSQVNLSALNVSGGEVLFNLSGNVSFGSFVETFSTTGNFFIINLTQNVTYNFFLTSRPNYTTNHEFNFQSVLINASVQDVNFSLFRDQSLFITFKDILTGDLLDLVTLFLFGSTNFEFLINQSLFHLGFPTGGYDLLATKSGFSSFTQTINITEGGLVNITVFLTNNSEDISFIVRNVAGGFIESASIKITRASDGVVIGEKFSDIFGAAEFSLNPDILYNLNVTRSGFLPFFGTLNAFQSTYTITLSTADVNQQGFIGLDYSFLPSIASSLTNGTLTNFSFNVSSDGFWDITSCTFSLLNDSFSGTVFDSNNSFCSITGGFAEFEFNTSTNTIIISRVELELNSTNNITIFRFYSITNNFQGAFSLKVFFDDLKSFTGSGFNTAGLFFLTVIVIIGLTIILGSTLSVFGEPEKMLIFTTILTGAASYIDLLNVSFTPAAFNPLGSQWIVFIVMSLLTIAAWLASPSWRLS